MKTNVLKRIPLNRLMDLKIDFAFKQLFGQEKNKDITIVFLNAILKRTGSARIRDLSLQNIEAGGEYEEDKQSRLDLLAVTNANEWVNIEIQFTNKYEMIKRSLELEAIAMKDETLHNAFENWERLSLTQEEVLAYEARLKRVLDEEAAVREAELREQEARERALQEGMKEGRQQEKEATAHLLLAEGFDVPTVSRLSRLKEEDVLRIQRDEK